MEQTILTDYFATETFVAFDTETTGMWAAVNRVVELAAVKFSLREGEIGRFQSLINPERQMPGEVIAIHGITDEMVADSPKVDQILPAFQQFCGDAILIAHNAPFDISFLGYEMSRCELSFGDNQVLDTVDIFHRFFPGLPSYSLLNLIKHFELASVQEHRALSDALFVRSLFELAAPKYPAVHRRIDFKKFLTVHSIQHWVDETASLPDDYSDLNYAIERKLRVEIVYNSTVQACSTRIIQPRQVVKRGSIFYIHAFCEQAVSERTFRLDRIASYRVIERE